MANISFLLRIKLQFSLNLFLLADRHQYLFSSLGSRMPENSAENKLFIAYLDNNCKIDFLLPSQKYVAWFPFKGIPCVQQFRSEVSLFDMEVPVPSIFEQKPYTIITKKICIHLILWLYYKTRSFNFLPTQQENSQAL